MPKLIRLYIKSCLIGFAIAAVFVALILWFNIANLGHLILGSDMAFVALPAMWILNGIVFAGVQFGIAVMGLASEDDDEDDDGPGGGLGVPVAIPVHAGIRGAGALPPKP